MNRIEQPWPVDGKCSVAGEQISETPAIEWQHQVIVASAMDGTVYDGTIAPFRVC